MELIYGSYGIEQAYFLLLIIPLMFVLYRRIKKDNMSRRKWLFLFSRFIIASLIVLSMSSPFITSYVDEFRDLSSITILYDESESMGMTDLDADVAEGLYSDISSAVGNITGSKDSVSIRYFSRGNRTELGNALYQETLKETREKNLIILLSDGKNNYGRDAVDMAQALRNANTTVYALLPGEVKNDIFIASMSGDKKTPANADYTLKIEVGKAGDDVAEYNLNLRVDGSLIHVVNNVIQKEEVKLFSFTFSVKDPGVHRVSAEINAKSDDSVDENNEMEKTVDVVDRPDVLLISDVMNSRLSAILVENYDVTRTPDPRQDVSKYDVVYLDNQPAEKLDSWVVNTLNQYLVDGNGLVVVGGEQAYERGEYYNKEIESILPVISKEPPEKKRKGVSMVVLLDRSGSAGLRMGGESKVDVGKALTLNVLDQLDEDDNVGVIAFDAQAYPITPLQRWGDVESDLKDKVLRLQAGMGGTDFYPALAGAEKMFSSCEDCDGKKFIVIISDGTISFSRLSTYIAQIQRMREAGVETYTISVTGAGDALTASESTMATIAAEGGGIYMKPDEYERLKLEFEDKEKEDKNMYSLGVYDKYHFITRDLVNFRPSIKEFNGVTEKSVSQVLVTTEGKMPVLAVWRFGLGRVAALTVDNGLDWAPNVYTSNNGEFISAITNWAIGDLEKRKRVTIQTVDVSFGDTSEIRIKSDKEPEVFIQKEGGDLERLRLKQVDIDLYTAEYTPKEPGFYAMRAVSSLGEDTDAISADIPIEYRDLGVDLEELRSITQSRTYNMSEMSLLEQDVLEYAKKSSTVEVLKKNLLRLEFMLAALILFFMDVVVRRVLDIVRLRRQG